MTETNGSFWVILPQLLYTIPTILVAIAAVIVCITNWQKAPTAAMFCLIGFGAIAFSSVFGAVVTAWMINSSVQGASRGQYLSLLSIMRIVLNTTGYVFLLISVFAGRPGETKSSPFNSPPSSSSR